MNKADQNSVNITFLPGAPRAFGSRFLTGTDSIPELLSGRQKELQFYNYLKVQIK
jgi:hypothetical protein